MLRSRVRELEARLEESEETLESIRRGDFDAVVVQGPAGERQVYTLDSADRPYRALIEQFQEGALTLSLARSGSSANPYAFSCRTRTRTCCRRCFRRRSVRRPAAS